MPKITKNHKDTLIALRLEKLELDVLDAFYEHWKTMSLNKLVLHTEEEREELKKIIKDKIEAMSNKDYLPQFDFTKRGAFKRSGIIRLALDEFLEKYDWVKTLNEGNAYTKRLNAFKFSMDDILEVREDLKERAKNEATEGKKYLYDVLQSFLYSHIVDQENSFTLKDDFYKVTQKLFVDQRKAKQIKEGK